jgi:type VI secretion system protein ImpH
MDAQAVASRLFAEGFSFDFFQAVRHLEQLYPDRKPVGRASNPRDEIVRFQARVSLDFPPSAIHELTASAEDDDAQVPRMVVAFMGMTGPSGVLPRHYTELLLRLRREAKGPERYALRDWLDLFNHRVISLFFRAWEKYHFTIPFERGEFGWRDQDAYTRCLLSLIGLGMPALQNRLRVLSRASPAKELGRIEDLSLLRFAGFFAHRPHNAVSLETMLAAYLRRPVRVQQFQGHWLKLDLANQSSLSPLGGNNGLGVNTLVGDRLWDVQSRIRIVIGPLDYATFQEFLPDHRPAPDRKKFFLLAQFIRLYVGPELDVELQLILKKEEVPGTQMGQRTGMGARLGWNTWAKRKPLPRDAEEAIFELTGELAKPPATA